MGIGRHTLSFSLWVTLAVLALPAEASEFGLPFDPIKNPDLYLQMQIRCTDLVVRGLVLSVNDSVGVGEINPATGRYRSIITIVKLRVHEILNGEHNNSTLTFWMDGGKRGDVARTYSEKTTFWPDQEALLFLARYNKDAPLTENLEWPAFVLQGGNLHYEIVNDWVYRGPDRMTPPKNLPNDQLWKYLRYRLYTLQFARGVIRDYLRSTSPESLAVGASTVVVGKAIDKRSETVDERIVWEYVEFEPELILKGNSFHTTLVIKAPKDVGRYGCVSDTPSFPLDSRLLVFLSGPEEGYFSPCGGWAAVVVLEDALQEKKILDRTRATVQP